MVKSNEALVIKTLEAKKELTEKKAQEKQEKWQLLKDKAMAKLLQEENKNMMMNRNDMDELTKEWHDIVRLEILDIKRLPERGHVMPRFGEHGGSVSGGGNGGGEDFIL
ncbi:hypothetical protein VPH35_024117 [Triticum aestivum]